MWRLLLKNRFKSKSSIPFISSKRMCDKPQKLTTKDTACTDTEAQAFVNQPLHIPTALERTILVWTKRYKSKEDIPKRVPTATIEKAKNKARIKVCNYMILATIIACFFVARSGRKAAERGESVAKMNLDWHKQINEQALQENKK